MEQACEKAVGRGFKPAVFADFVRLTYPIEEKDNWLRSFIGIVPDTVGVSEGVDRRPSRGVAIGIGPRARGKHAPDIPLSWKISGSIENGLPHRNRPVRIVRRIECIKGKTMGDDRYGQQFSAFEILKTKGSNRLVSSPLEPSAN